VRGTVESLMEVFDEFGVEVYEYIDAEPWVICDGRWYGKAAGSEIQIGGRVTDAYEVKDGKVVRAIMSYGDVPEALEAVALIAG
jgi:hypothetical protein